MNIFYVDADPRLAAQALVDRHGVVHLARTLVTEGEGL